MPGSAPFCLLLLCPTSLGQLHLGIPAALPPLPPLPPLNAGAIKLACWACGSKCNRTLIQRDFQSKDDSAEANTRTWQKQASPQQLSTGHRKF